MLAEARVNQRLRLLVMRMEINSIHIIAIQRRGMVERMVMIVTVM